MITNIIIFLIIAKFGKFSASGTECNCTPVISNMQKFEDHVLKRRIRSVVFPNKANLLLTPAFTKAVLDGRPRGLSYSVEFDMYHPLPDTIEGWQPTILINKFNKPKPLTKSETENVNIEKIPNMEHLFPNMPDNYDRYLYNNYNENEFPFIEIGNSNGWKYFEPEWDGESEFFDR